ncbi:MAG: hypothetical protein E6J62_05215 [Deltaproteobacteria bacterium]|nr:MAG: hypothetical protein E6J62_05215 [Deltaproteobacteria bacterium]
MGKAIVIPLKLNGAPPPTSVTATTWGDAAGALLQRRGAVVVWAHVWMAKYAEWPEPIAIVFTVSTFPGLGGTARKPVKIVA